MNQPVMNMIVSATAIMRIEMTLEKKGNKNVADIFNEYQSPLKGYIAKRVSSKEDAEDILQNVFYQLAKIDLFENPIERISSWLYSVARNQIIDRSRKHREVEMPQVVQKGDDSFLTEITEILLFETDASPEMEFLRTMIWEELDVALDELPAEQREVFELTEIEGFSFKEIAESADIPVNTLISRKRYAVLHLRERLRHLYDELLSD